MIEYDLGVSTNELVKIVFQTKFDENSTKLNMNYRIIAVFFLSKTNII